MSVVDIRVDFPSYSRSFNVSVESQATVQRIKEEIQHKCPGQPRPEGQRLIWRGRLLANEEQVDNLWKSEPRIVHLAVHPSAWTSLPPEIPNTDTPSQSRPPTPPLSYQSRTITAALDPRSNSAAPYTSEPGPPYLSYVRYKHELALSKLSSLPAPAQLEQTITRRFLDMMDVERYGWTWPEILDEEFPAPSEGGVSYEITTIEGQPHLQLLSPDAKPTPAQEHALKVLSYTFTILLEPPIPIPDIPDLPFPQPHSTIPHVNRLLQEMGLPALRVNNQPVVNVNNPARADIHADDFPYRPLLVPVIWVLLRTALLFYFIVPARTPIMAILVMAWLLYEVWQPVRRALIGREALARIPEVQRRADNGVGAGQGQNNAPQANGAPQNGFQVPALNQPQRPNLFPNGLLDQPATVLLDNLANLNIAEEERIINSTPGTPTVEPGLGHKFTTFLSLFIATLHPAIWNRRRVALRRREGVVRTEANARNAPPPASPTEGESESTTDRATQIREELRAQFDRRPRWIQQYMQRVVAEDWVDDSD